MRSIDESKRQRDAALEGWRKELRRLFEMERSQRERAQQAVVELQKQKAIVNEARAIYDRANEDYLNRVHNGKSFPNGHGFSHRPRA